MSLKKSLLLAFLVTLVSFPSLWFTTILPHSLSTTFFKQAPTYFKTVLDETFPPDLEITVTNGVVSINKPTPYCLLIDTESKLGILFDPNFNLQMLTPTTISNYPLCAPFMIIQESTILYADENSLGYSAQEIAPTINMVLTKDTLDELSATTLPVLLKWGWLMYLAAPIFLVPLCFLVVLFLNCWYGLINKIVFSLLDNDEYASFSAAYALSLRFFTMLIIFYTMLLFYSATTNTPPIAINFPFFNTIVITILSVCWANYHRTKTITNTTPKEQSKAMESHVIPDPNASPTLTLSDSDEKPHYSFDPSVISPPPTKETSVPTTPPKAT